MYKFLFCYYSPLEGARARNFFSDFAMHVIQYPQVDCRRLETLFFFNQKLMITISFHGRFTAPVCMGDDRFEALNIATESVSFTLNFIIEGQ